MTLRGANQAFSRCIREVEAGEELSSPERGQPVAHRSCPAKARTDPEQQATRARAREIMEKGWPIGAGPLNPDELYDNIRTPHDPQRRR